METVYLFTSQTCAPCKVVKPLIEDLKEDFPNFNWQFIDIKNDPKNLAIKYSINYVPTMIAVVEDKEVGRHSGSVMMGYYTLLKKLRNN